MNKKHMVYVILAIVILILVTLIGKIKHCENMAKYVVSDEDMNNIKTTEGKCQVEFIPISGKYLNGFHVIPDKLTHKGVIITFGGSEGECQQYTAIDIAKKGYEVLALYYFGRDNQNLYLDMVPIDKFEEVLDYIRKECSEKEPITLIGVSRGAELSLLLASYYDEIDNLVLYLPSIYTFNGKYNSSWSYNKKGIPYISLSHASNEAYCKYTEVFNNEGLLHQRPLFESAIAESANRENARIKVEKLKNNILLFAGCDDQLWPSDTMAFEIKKRKPKNTELYLYKDTGHLFGGGSTGCIPGIGEVYFGGENESNVKAKEHSDFILYNKLEVWHRK